jgi:hypothetical protein
MKIGTRESTLDERADEFPTADDTKKAIDRAIPPGAEMRQGSEETDTINVHDLVGAGGMYAYVWGVVYYDDGYTRRFTKFRHRYAIASHERGHPWEIPAETTRAIIAPDKARLHPFGNNMN